MILLTGGSGRLGTELRKLTDWYAPPHAEFDILKPVFAERPELIVHAAAYTDVLGAERDRAACWHTNCEGTYFLATVGVPLVYISTEYVFDGKIGHYDEDDEVGPVNFYAESKFFGELACRAAPRSLVIRCLFKPRPFQHPAAVTDQYTTGDYVDVIAPMIVRCVEWFRAGRLSAHDTLHIGTGLKSTYDLAKQTRPNVRQITRADVAVPLPYDTSLNLEKFHALAQAIDGH